MTLSQFGRYTIIDEIGRGGFATVYRAMDQVLQREVALKVIRPWLMGDSEYVVRFQREARIAAQLDHPRIVSILDFGEHDGRLFLVMKLMRGGSLATLLQNGPLPWKQAVAWTGAIAEGLDYAHQKGLVHRDIKPDNILFDEQGQPVIADFGIVKALENSTASLSISGGILGTPAYISPEIWNGMPASPATDVYALTCLVYEMSTGRKLFDAPTPPAIMALHFRPVEFSSPWPTGVPDQIGMVLQKGLAQRPEERFRSPVALAVALEELLSNPSEVGENTSSKIVPNTSVVPDHPGKSLVMPYAKYTSCVGGLVLFMVVGLMLAVLAAVLWNNNLADDGESTPVVQTVSDETAIAGDLLTLVLSPVVDATIETIVVPTTTYTRPRPTSTPSPLPTATLTPSKTVTTTPTPTFTPSPVGGGAGQIAFVSDRDGNQEIYLMNVDGSNQVNLSSNSGDDFDPAWSSDGTKLLFVSKRDGNEEVYVMNADGSDPINLTQNSARDRYPAWSPNGQQVAFETYRDGNWEVYIMNPDGSNQINLTNSSGDDYSLAWSPDGQKIAFASSREGDLEIFTMDADGSNPTRLTYSSRDDYRPSWSPNGQRIAFISDRDGNYEVYTMNVDGSSLIRLTNNNSNEYRPIWSTNGQEIIFASARDGNLAIFVMNSDGSEQTKLTNQIGSDYSPAWRP